MDRTKANAVDFIKGNELVGDIIKSIEKLEARMIQLGEVNNYRSELYDLQVKTFGVQRILNSLEEKA